MTSHIIIKEDGTIDWEENLVVAASFGVFPTQFWEEVDLREWNLFCRGQMEKFKTRRRESAFLLAYLLSPWTGKGKKLKPSDFYPKEWDRDTGSSEPVRSKEDMQRRVDDHARMLEAREYQKWLEEPGNREMLELLEIDYE